MLLARRPLFTCIRRIGAGILATVGTLPRHSCVTPISRCFGSVLSELTEQKSTESKTCSGCGVTLQSESPTLLGYIPEGAKMQFATGSRMKSVRVRGEEISQAPPGATICRKSSARKLGLKSSKILCQLCFSLVHYRNVPDTVSIAEASMSEMTSINSVLKLVDEFFAKQDVRKLCLYVVDASNVECSLVPALYEALCTRKLPVLVVLNKADKLAPLVEPEQLKKWTRSLAKQIRNLSKDAVVALSSSTRPGKGFEELERSIGSLLGSKDEQKSLKIAVIGRANSGKSSFVNCLVKFLNEKSKADHTVSALPGTTSLHGVRAAVQGKGRVEILDTPGVVDDEGRSIDSNLVHRCAHVQPDLSKSLVRILEALQSPVAPFAASIKRGSTIEVYGEGELLGLFKLWTTGNVVLNFPEKLRVKIRHSPGKLAKFNHTVLLRGSKGKAVEEAAVAGLGWVTWSSNTSAKIQVAVSEGVHVFQRPALCTDWLRKKGLAGPKVLAPVICR